MAKRVVLKLAKSLGPTPTDSGNDVALSAALSAVGEALSDKGQGEVAADLRARPKKWLKVLRRALVQAREKAAEVEDVGEQGSTAAEAGQSQGGSTVPGPSAHAQDTPGVAAWRVLQTAAPAHDIQSACQGVLASSTG